VQELAAAALQALAHPSRRAIVEQLGNGDRPVAELTRKLRISQPAVSRHLRLLRQAGLADSQPWERAICTGFAATAPTLSRRRAAGAGARHHPGTGRRR